MKVVISHISEGAITEVRISSVVGDEFFVKLRVHQGFVLSSFLFIIAMEVVTEDTRKGVLHKIRNVYDLLLISESMEDFEKV